MSLHVSTCDSHNLIFYGLQVQYSMSYQFHSGKLIYSMNFNYAHISYSFATVHSWLKHSTMSHVHL